MKLTKTQLKQLIKEELARGIPDYAFNGPTDEALRLLAQYFKTILVTHINHTSKDSSSRQRKYSAADVAAASIINDKELKKFIEEKLKEKLLIFIDQAK
jgi:hypothetical protein